MQTLDTWHLIQLCNSSCDRLEQQIDAATDKQTELLDALMTQA
jgi:hypothetical protein